VRIRTLELSSKGLSLRDVKKVPHFGAKPGAKLVEKKIWLFITILLKIAAN
jgi:hypothetical protein